MSVSIGSERGAIALCSRGLAHSRTWESIEEARFINSAGFHNWKTHFTHDLPIPHAQNEIVERITRLDPGAEWILFVEEDIVIPHWIFQHFDRSPVQAVNYSLPGGTDSIRRNRRGEVLFCGLGCTLIHKNVLVSLPAPLFQTSPQFTEEDGRLVPNFSGEASYGGHDIYFCHALQERGIKIREVPRIRAEHLRVSKFGDSGKNIGYHDIVSL